MNRKHVITRTDLTTLAGEINAHYLTCPDAGKHECTESCHFYGFHSLRRGYATLNADTMSGPVLQRKMRHKSFTTTLRYISLADKMKVATEAVHVPAFLQKKAAN